MKVATKLAARFAQCEPMTNLSHVVLGEMRSWILDAKHGRRRPSALCAHIGEIVGLCSKEHVIGAHASAHIASMTQPDRWRQKSVGQFPRDAMTATDPRPHADLTVPVRAEGCHPQPAWSAKGSMNGAGLIDFQPEASLESICVIHT